MARERKLALGAKQTRIFLVDYIRKGIEVIYWEYENHEYSLYDILCERRSGPVDSRKAIIFDYYPYWCSSIENLMKAKRWLDDDFKKTAARCLSAIPKYEPTADANDMVAEGEYNKFLFQKAMKSTIIDKKLKELKDSWNRRTKMVDPPPNETELEPYWKRES